MNAERNAELVERAAASGVQQAETIRAAYDEAVRRAMAFWAKVKERENAGP